MNPSVALVPSSLSVTGICIVCLCAGCVTPGLDRIPTATGVSLDGLTPNARQWVDAALALFDGEWDEEAGMSGRGRSHSTRGTMIYATSILLRNAPGDSARAHVAMASVLRQQYDAPGKPWHGTYRRHEHEPDPTSAGAWLDNAYDPNWREFIGVHQIIALEVCGGRIEECMRTDLLAALRLACEGAHARDVRPTYSNIALMSAYLLGWGGRRFDVPEWAEHGAALARRIHAHFQTNGAFSEYNSPTYYGVDLFALALWRAMPLTEEMARMGTEMEAGLWRDIGLFYHAGMRNLCGPYDRSYGMDMRHYHAMVGAAIALASDSRAALPDDFRAGHTHDFAFLPLMAAMRMAVPPEVLPHLLAFQGERRVERVIVSGRNTRTARAWLGESLMIGVEEVSGQPRSSLQFHPVTAHWRMPNGDIGWIRLLNTMPVKAGLDGRTASMAFARARGSSGDNAIVFEIRTPGADSEDFSSAAWHLPGLNVSIDTSLGAPIVAERDGRIELRYPLGDADAAHLSLTFQRSR